MLFFLITFLSFSFLLISKPLILFPSWANDMRLLSFFFYQDLIKLIKTQILIKPLSCNMNPKKRWINNKVGNVEEIPDCSLLDLPELALEIILSKLPPSSLCAMASVCTELRSKCKSDSLWERHMKEKWGKVVGPASQREWELFLASHKSFEISSLMQLGAKRKWFGVNIPCVWPISWIKSKIGTDKIKSIVPDSSIMSWYISLQSGKFWFPAQVYNREHGHVGFMLSCYDAEVSYDSHTDTFNARYPPHGRRTVVLEENVNWDRVRAPPVSTPAHDLHLSDCLHELEPGNHIEIQWRRNAEFPYGWWYGVVGHLETCDGNEHFCRCHLSDTIVLEFNQYTAGSRWRRASICRKDHKEEGNATDGFYGGIRKLQSKEEIAMWRQLWPIDILE
ncbi:hypothetical protein LUZ60_003978 [Juncus effusus]|nr:hypothetical protein LUZ60_003978 [Juncus effusus]